MLPAGKDDIGYLVNHAGRRLQRQLDVKVREMGIDWSRYTVLRSIHDERSPSTVDGIATGLGIDRAVISSTISRMLSEGWLEETRDPANPAATLLALTNKAKVIMPAIVASAHWTIEEGLNGFTNEETEQLKAYLQRLVDNLERIAAP